jgi:outer membrane lipoprotein-sorting protein
VYALYVDLRRLRLIKKFLSPTFFLALLICPIASAQSVDDLIKKNMDAHGGAQRLKAIKSTKAAGKIQMQGINAPVTIITKRPNFARVEINLQIGPYIEAFDGQTAWRVNPLTGSHAPETISGEEAKDILETADMEGPLVDYRRKGHKLELAGREKVEGVDTYKLKLTLKSGEVKYIYLNTRTHLEVKQTTRRLDHGVEIEVETYYGDYKPVDGILIAHSYEARVGGQTVQITTIEKIEINSHIDDDIFKMPIKAELHGTELHGR